MRTDNTFTFATLVLCLLCRPVFFLSCSYQSLGLEFPSARWKFSAAQLLHLKFAKWLGKFPKGQLSFSTLCCISSSTALTSTLLQKLWTICPAFEVKRLSPVSYAEHGIVFLLSTFADAPDKKCFPVNPLSTVFGIKCYKHSLSMLHSPSQAMAFLSESLQQPGHPVDHRTWFKLNCIKPHRENPVHSLWRLTPGCLLDFAMPLALLSMKCHWLGGKSWQEDRKQHSAFSI